MSPSEQAALLAENERRYAVGRDEPGLAAVNVAPVFDLAGLRHLDQALVGILQNVLGATNLLFVFVSTTSAISTCDRLP